MNNFESLIKQHPSFLYTEELKMLCQPLQLLNITTFNHVRMHNTHHFTAIITNPECVKNYLEKEYFNVEIFAAPKHCHLKNTIIWDQLSLKDKALEMLMDAEAFDYRHIFTIIREQHTCIDYYYFGTHLLLPSMNQWYINHYDLLEKFIDYYEDEISKRSHLQYAHQCPIYLEKTRTEDLLTSDFESLPNAQKVSDFLKQLPSKAIHSFTRREQDIIPLLLQSLTNKQIAKALNLSYRTIDEHIVNLKRKLKVANKSQLIIRLLS
jgi:DNA-binding CsgD family transcriptional regulator